MKSAVLCTLLFALAFADKDTSLLGFKTRPVARPSSWNKIEEEISLAAMNITPVFVPSAGDEVRRGANVSLLPSQDKEMEESAVEVNSVVLPSTTTQEKEDLQVSVVSNSSEFPNSPISQEEVEDVRKRPVYPLLLPTISTEVQEDLLVPIVKNSIESPPTSSSQEKIKNTRRWPVYPLLPNIQLKEKVDSSVSNKSSVFLYPFLNETEESSLKRRPVNFSSSEAQSTRRDTVPTLTSHPSSWFDIQDKVLLAALNITNIHLPTTKNQSDAEGKVSEVSGPVDFPHENQPQEDTVERQEVFLATTVNHDSEAVLTSAASTTSEFPPNSSSKNEELVGRRPFYESLIRDQPNLEGVISTFTKKPELPVLSEERNSNWTPNLQYPSQMNIPPETVVHMSKKGVLHPSYLNNEASMNHPQFISIPPNMPLKEEGLPVMEHASDIFSLLWNHILQRIAALRFHLRRNVNHYNALQISHPDKIAVDPLFPLVRVDFALAALRKLIAPVLEFGGVGAVVWLLTYIGRRIFLRFKKDDHHKPCH